MYSEPFQISTMERFAKGLGSFHFYTLRQKTRGIPPKNVKKLEIFWRYHGVLKMEAVNCFHKKLHLRCLTGF